MESRVRQPDGGVPQDCRKADTLDQSMSSWRRKHQELDGIPPRDGVTQHKTGPVWFISREHTTIVDLPAQRRAGRFYFETAPLSGGGDARGVKRLAEPESGSFPVRRI